MVEVAVEKSKGKGGKGGKGNGGSNPTQCPAIIPGSPSEVKPRGNDEL